MQGNEPPHASDDWDLVVHLPDGRSLDLSRPFLIGREAGCEVRIEHNHVSRRHAEVSLLRGQWVIRDLQSSNGLFVGGKRATFALIGQGIDVTLGTDGPMVRIEPVAPAAEDEAHDEPLPAPKTQLDAYAQRYFGQGDDEDESAGEHTMMIRRAFQDLQRKQRRRHRLTIAALAVVAMAITSYAVYQFSVIRRYERLAARSFYEMKRADMEFAELEQKLAKSGNAPDRQVVAHYLEQRRRQERDYEQYADTLVDRNMDEADRLILRVTRLFGECDATAPPGYVGEVKRYIREWRSSGRFAKALKVAQKYGYAEPIADAFASRGLPPQYFYLAMVESDFDRFAVGTPTRYGYAKGMWQFIPETGRRYGLKNGPLVATARPDGEDDRSDWQKATVAAASYVKDIYATDAQASGLLVMASYNWGEGRVIKLLQSMPPNPRERNFWQVLEKHRNSVPDESYNYVFRIVSAAVIGENPRLFGFDFDNPLAFVEQRQRGSGRASSAAVATGADAPAR